MLFLAVVLVRKHSYRRFLTLVQSLTELQKKSPFQHHLEARSE